MLPRLVRRVTGKNDLRQSRADDHKVPLQQAYNPYGIRAGYRQFDTNLESHIELQPTDNILDVGVSYKNLDNRPKDGIVYRMDFEVRTDSSPLPE